ncbi:MAG: DNA repair protein RadC [Alphaproteobacteria bacterium]|nr:DNA repair protein RadC [Alphaproteobacteria bacterium]
MSADADDAKPHYLGHRQRLRERFMRAGAEALADYELIELLLGMAQPRGDMKPVAKALIARFGSFAEVVSAEPADLAAIAGTGPVSVAALKLVREAAVRLARQQVLARPVLSSWEALLDYCTAAMANLRSEQFRLLFLDRKNVLIADEVQQRGTIDQAPVYPREVARRSLELHASAVIMVHNHPTGDPTPSKADGDMTRQVKEALKAVGVTLHDHVVIGRGSYWSFRSQGMI